VGPELGGNPRRRVRQARKDKNFDQIQKDIYGEFENTFMMYLPRLCEHCLNPACAASCPSGAIYKREEDGIVLIDQDKCRGWRMCVSGCPYKKIYFNWKSGKSEKCIFCYPRIEAGSPPCARNLRGPHPLPRRAAVRRRPHQRSGQRQRAGPVREAAGNLPRPERPGGDPPGPGRWRAAVGDRLGATLAGLQNGRRLETRAAAAPEYRTLPMVWYVPPLSPIQNAAAAGTVGMNGVIPDVDSLRIPLRYLANLLTAGDEKPVKRALKRLLAMRAYKRSQQVDGVQDLQVLEDVGLSVEQVERCTATWRSPTTKTASWCRVRTVKTP
jgi:nitrate reductase beta subunit